MSVYCTLTIGGLLLEKDIDRLAKEMLAAGADDVGPHIPDLLRDGSNQVIFSATEEGAIDLDLQDMLEDLNLSYIWYQSAGEENAEDEILHDARTGESAHYLLHNSEIMLTIADIDTDGVLDAARRWQLFKDDLELTVIRSNHEAVAMMSEDHPLHAYARRMIPAQPETA